ncbi:MAG TPA: hypothetical protein VGH99_20335 [Pseudonocardia sp.]
MTRGTALADYLRTQAQWRGDKADRTDDDRNTRSGLALLDVAAVVERLPDDDARLARMATARYFDLTDHCMPGERGQEVIRRYCLDRDTSSPDQFLAELASAADRDTYDHLSDYEDDPLS